MVVPAPGSFAVLLTRRQRRAVPDAEAALRVRGAYTNTVPVDAYRGSGRPEATFVNERLLENGAREMGIDVVEIRRRNLIPEDRFPYPTPGGRVYDSGDPPALFEKLLAIADYEGLRAEQKVCAQTAC